MHNALTPPWLADDAQLELTFKKGKTPLSHRRWPGEPVPLVKVERLQRLANDIASRSQPLAWEAEQCTAEWQQAIAQAMRCVGEARAAMPARALAVLTRLAEEDSPALLDEIVQLHGVEYATEVVIARQNIAAGHSKYPPRKWVFSHPQKENVYGLHSETYSEFDLRLRKHLSLAEEVVWQRCAEKLIAGLVETPFYRQPFIALLLPERPDIANQIAGRCIDNSWRSSKEWLKAVATDPAVLAKLEETWSSDIFTDRQDSDGYFANRYGYVACAALLREQGLAAVARLAIYAHKDDCGSLLAQINHPQVIRLLLLVADKNKPSQLRVAKYARQFPASTLAALAAGKPACFFNDLPLRERIRRKGGIVLRELGFEDMYYLFHQYTLNGQQIHFEPQYHRYSEKPVWNEAAMQALHHGDCNILLQAWQSHLTAGYKPNDCWNLYLLAQLPRERVITLWQRINEENFKFVGAEYLLSILGTDALSGLLLALRHRPKEIFPLLMHLGATELALPVARVWRRFQAQSHLARQWLLQWPEHAAAALIPLAFDKAGDSREAAINALRLLYQEGHHALLQTVAQRWHEPRLWPALEQLLTQDPLDNYPARTPKAPDFWQPALWRRPRLLSNDQPLTDDALEILGDMLRFAQGGHFYCGLDLVKAACQPQSLAAFAWDLFKAWQNAGAPGKENWAFQTLGIFGDESTVRDLTQLILAWPQEGKSARAASGLHLLTRIGSDMSLLQLDHISQRAKSRPLRESAERCLQEIAEARDLSEEQLQDRLTPTLGLDNPGALTFDFGTRSFSVRFDENLQPVIYDQQGARQKSLPRLRAEDDQTKAAEALLRLKGLKKDAARVAKRLLPHLENALRLARRWTRAEFQSLFVDHPLTHNVTRRLVWGVYAANEPRRLLAAFRIAAEGEFCDGQDEPITLPEDALFGIVHPLEMDDLTRAAFEQLFADYQLLPPFRQLTRHTLLLLPEETSVSKLTRWQGKSTTCGQLLGIRRRGWWQGSESYFCYDVAQHRLILEITPGFVHYSIDAKAPQQFGAITLYYGEQPVAFSRLDPQDLSEALSTIEIISR